MISDREKKHRIMVVEDEALVAMDLSRRISSLDYEVVGTADNREEALALAEETRPHLILMDINIIGPADGIQVAREIREKQDVPIVFLTAFADDSTVERAKKITPYGYLLKPFDERTLRTTLEVALHRHQADSQMRVLSTAIASASVGIVICTATDDTRPIEYCNRAFLDMTGLTLDEVLNQPACFLAAPEQPQAPVTEFRSALGRREPGSVVVKAMRKDSSHFWSAVDLSPIKDASGTITRMIMFHIDITRRRATEAALAEAQRLDLLGRLTAGVAHDFNNVLAAIRAFTEFAQEGLGRGDPRREDLEEVIGASKRGAALARQLLSFVHRGESTQRHVDLNLLLQRSDKMLQRIVGSSVQIEIRTSAQPLVIYADPIAIEQILLNLAVKSHETMPEGGRLTLALNYAEEGGSSDKRRQVARLLVKDNGSGMTEARKSEFFHANVDPISASNPLDLGLAAIRAAIDNLGGSIRIDSQLDVGTSFTIDVPLSGSMDWDEESNTVVPDHTNCQGSVALLAEENPALRAASARALRQVGFEVHVAANAEEAIAQVQRLRNGLELLICDVALPGSGTSAVLEQARDIAPVAQVLLITGFLDDQLNLGDQATRVLWKPFSMSTLVRRAVATVNGEESERSIVSRPQPTPIAPSVRSTRGDNGLANLASSGRHVLLVDGDAALRKNLRTHLEAVPYRVSEAESGTEGLERIQAGDIDLIVSDVEMTPVSGLDLLQAAQLAAPPSPVILITSAPSVESATAAMRNRAAGYLVKPFEIPSLLQEVDRVMSEIEVAKLQRHLLLERLGAEEYLDDLATTEQLFEKALQELYMAYQPLVRAHDGTVYAYEALVRSKSKKMPTPAQLISAAEVLNRMHDLGRAARRCIADTLDRFPERSEPIFVNLHPSELRSSFLCSADEPLHRFAPRIVLEVTERAALSDTVLGEDLETLRRSGYRVALDDMGEGYAGLSWLVKLQPEIAKLDMSLVRDIHRSAIKREIVRSLVAVCRRSSIMLVAEGVETSVEAEALTDMGCDLLQGYFFGRPSPPFSQVS